LAIKWGGIMSLDDHRTLMLIVVPAYARGAQIFGILFLPYGRPDGGTGHALFGSSPRLASFAGLVIPVALSCYMGWRGLWLNVWFVAMTFAILAYYKKRLGCITGDMLGAMTEILEPTLFLLAAMSAMPR
jgi:adenosylcobinamide-GDP ribazoletransferase